MKWIIYQETNPPSPEEARYLSVHPDHDNQIIEIMNAKGWNINDFTRIDENERDAKSDEGERLHA